MATPKGGKSEMSKNKMNEPLIVEVTATCRGFSKWDTDRVNFGSMRQAESKVVLVHPNLPARHTKPQSTGTPREKAVVLVHPQILGCARNPQLLNIIKV